VPCFNQSRILSTYFRRNFQYLCLVLTKVGFCRHIFIRNPQYLCPVLNKVGFCRTIFVRNPQYQISRKSVGGPLLHTDKSTEQTKLTGAFRDLAKAPTDRQTDGHEKGNRLFTVDYAIAVVFKHPPRRGHGPKKEPKRHMYEL
jgi:hypothetical protein